MSSTEKNNLLSKATDVADSLSTSDDDVLEAHDILVSSDEIRTTTFEGNEKAESVISSADVATVLKDKSTETPSKSRLAHKSKEKKKGGLSMEIINKIKERQAARIQEELELKQIEAAESSLKLEIQKYEKQKMVLSPSDGQQNRSTSAVSKQHQHRKKESLTSKNDQKPAKKGILYNDRPKRHNPSSETSSTPILPNVQHLELAETKNNDMISMTNDQSIFIEEIEENEVTASPRPTKPELSETNEIDIDCASAVELRAPILCVLGHVDAGKTTILDNLRETHVQKKEAGGITQQIGITNIPLRTIRDRTMMCQDTIRSAGGFRIPGLLIIDTPGHETFKNLRSRGSSLCDLVILVVDIMHGLAPQTLESIRLLTQRQIPFIIALNKIDLMYGWQSDSQTDIQFVLKKQKQITRNQFEKLYQKIVVQFAEQEINVALYHENPDPNEYISIVPISAKSGEGMGSLLALALEKCQSTLANRIEYSEDLQASVIEVKTILGLGTIIDVALVNGRLSVGDKIILSGQEGPIITQIRSLLMPEFNEELRVTSRFQQIHRVKGACGIRIIGKDLEKAIAGLPLHIVHDDDEQKALEEEIERTLQGSLNNIQTKDKGVYIQASTLGSLEAFAALLNEARIPCAGVNIGPVHRKDIIRASTQLEKGEQWAVILAFDVRVERDAQEYAANIGIRIFQDDEVYRLRQKYVNYQEDIRKAKKEEHHHLAVFPCQLRILPDCIYNDRDPLIFGVVVEKGFIQLGTPICVPSRGFLDLGRIISIQINHKPLTIAKAGSTVAIKIEPIPGDSPRMYGRHFDYTDSLISKISRQSIDILKDYFRDEMRTSDWELIIELKKILHIN